MAIGSLRGYAPVKSGIFPLCQTDACLIFKISQVRQTCCIVGRSVSKEQGAGTRSYSREFPKRSRWIRIRRKSGVFPDVIPPDGHPSDFRGCRYSKKGLRFQPVCRPWGLEVSLQFWPELPFFLCRAVAKALGRGPFDCWCPWQNNIRCAVSLVCTLYIYRYIYYVFSF